MSERPTGWESLSPAARGAVAEVIRRLAAKFTGTIQLDCNQGGVRNLTTSSRLDGGDLGKIGSTG